MKKRELVTLLISTILILGGIISCSNIENNSSKRKGKESKPGGQREKMKTQNKRKQNPKLTQTHVHRVNDAIQSSHPLPSPSPPGFNLSQYRGLFQ